MNNEDNESWLQSMAPQLSGHAIPTAEIVGGIVTLLLLGVAVLAASKRLRLPFTVALLLAGISLAWCAKWLPHPFEAIQRLSLSPDLVLYVFLPTLVFEACLHFDTRQLRRDLGSILTLAVPGLLLSTLLVGGIVALTTAIPLPAALLLGAILSATDPVAVIALFREVGAPQRLAVLVEGESLFNDATSIVLARILMAVVLAGAVSAASIGMAALSFLLLFAGGLAVGGALGLAVGYLLTRVESDTYIEITLTTVLAYLSFLLAEEVFGVSGIMATIGAGLVQGGWGRWKVSPSVRAYLDHFWEYMAFIANALIFLMVGLRLDLNALVGVMNLLPWVVLAVLVSRAAVVYGLLPLSERLAGREAVDWRYQTIIFWGGLRGAVALALALGLPHFEYSDTFVALVMGVVLFTLLVQATSIRYLIERLGLARIPLAERLAQLEAILESRKESLRRIDLLERSGLFSGPIATSLRQECGSDTDRAQSQISLLRQSELDTRHERQLLLLRGLAVERALLLKLFNQGHLSEGAFRQLTYFLARQADSVRHSLRAREMVRGPRRRQKLRRELIQWAGRVPGVGGLLEKWQMSRVARDYEMAWSLDQGCQAVLEKLQEWLRDGEIPMEREREVRTQYEQWRTSAREQIDNTAEQLPEFVKAMQQRMGQRLILLAEEDAIQQQAELGLLRPALAERRLKQNAQQQRPLRGQETHALHVEPTELLRKLPFLQQMSAVHFAALAKRMQSRTIARKQIVIGQGDAGNSMFFIARGVLRVIREDAHGIRELRTLLAGDFFGEIALLHDVLRTATVMAVTPCILYELSREDVIEAMQTYPGIRAALEQVDLQRFGGES